MKKLGLIIGRFQPMHIGHELLIETSLKENTSSLILIGSSNISDSFNPYSYLQRKNLMSQQYQQDTLSLGELPDFPNDEDWIDMILSYIPEQVSEVSLYCGDKENDSAVIALDKFKNTLPFSLQIKEIPRSIIPVSATQVRKWIKSKESEKLKKYLSEKTLLSLGIAL